MWAGFDTEQPGDLQMPGLEKERAQMALVSTIEEFGRRPEKTEKLQKINWTHWQPFHTISE